MEVFGSSHGIEGYSETGCNCHGSNPGVETYVEIIGIPDNYSHGEIYELTIILSGGPQEAEQGHRGGFNLKASDGDFSSKDSATYITENGEFDIITKVEADDDAALTRCIVEDIRTIEGITETRTLIGAEI
jgi:hypothetical protein